MPQEAQASLVAGIHRDAQWLVRVTENLLSVTRFSGSEVKLKKEDEVLEEIIGSAILKYHQTPGALPVKVETPEDILLVPADGVLLEQVLINFFDNVSAHAEGATQIWLYASATSARVVVSVETMGRASPPLSFPTYWMALCSKPTACAPMIGAAWALACPSAVPSFALMAGS